MTKRNSKIDLLRGLAIFLMLWGHVLQATSSDFLANWLTRAIYNLTSLVLACLYAGVLLVLGERVIKTKIGRILVGEVWG